MDTMMGCCQGSLSRSLHVATTTSRTRPVSAGHASRPGSGKTGAGPHLQAVLGNAACQAGVDAIEQLRVNGLARVGVQVAHDFVVVGRQLLGGGARLSRTAHDGANLVVLAGKPVEAEVGQGLFHVLLQEEIVAGVLSYRLVEK